MLVYQKGLTMSCAVCAGHSSYNCPCCGEDVRMIECPDCNGTGHTPFMAFDIIKRIDVPVTELAYLILPDDEDEANYFRKRYCKQELDTCPTCRGLGEIPEDY